MTAPKAPAPPAVRVDAPTEERNPRSLDIDRLDTVGILRLINDEDTQVPRAVAEVLDAVAAAVDFAVAALRAGHRVHYFGAGTSGRIAFADAAELRPTFNVPEGWFCPHLAGGPEALWQALEEVEDDADSGAAQVRECVAAGDVVVGLAASGRTPFVLGALRAAGATGARTVLITGNPRAPMAAHVDVSVGVDTGPEVITGSTRMKAGTAQKLVLNAFSTAVMVRLGRVHSNLMVSLVPTNAKLRGRVLSILVEATGLGEDVCATALAAAGGELKTALVGLLSGAAVPAARAALAQSGDRVRDALALLSDAA